MLLGSKLRFGGTEPFTVSLRKGPRHLKQYSREQMDLAIADVVERGKTVKASAIDNGVPLSSLYEKLKSHHELRDKP